MRFLSYYILFIFVNKRPDGPVACRKVDKALCMRGQGFDPCLQHLLFFFQFPCRFHAPHLQRTIMRPQISPLGSISSQIQRSKKAAHCECTEASYTEPHAGQLGHHLGPLQILAVHPQITQQHQAQI